ncbi:META domain-containing protein [Pseudomonas sp. RP23018S]|uniref:META domain-containing protein n=1 Tax=Pseudomonas sp. RP23018S TaxID=3096037 RepID=UPI002ACA6BC9|nr:META domain-containing protein [Pseudomonas sp. RP23018S]MDZ5601390.1 META domain-containing protein [Pseudomonas sp. RP23018S]
MKARLAGAVIALTLAGCASAPDVLQQDHSYVLEWIGERPLMDFSHVTLTLGADGRAYGNAGCNHWFAPYTLNGDALHFGHVGSTRKLCAPALMEQEGRFLKALETVQRWDVSHEGQVRFWPHDGKALRFWPDEG